MRESVVITIRDVIARSDLLTTSRLIIWYLLNDVRFNVKVKLFQNVEPTSLTFFCVSNYFVFAELNANK